MLTKIEGFSIFIRNTYRIDKTDPLKIERIIVKFLSRESNIQELDDLDVWLRNDKNREIFNRFVKTEYITILSMAEYDVDKAKEAIRQRLKNTERKRKSVRYGRMAVAASIVLIFGILFFKSDKGVQEVEVEVSEVAPAPIQGGFNKAILTLDNGNEITLEKGKEYETGKAKGSGEELVYYVDGEIKENENRPQYNYLTIPRGGQFFVQLSDGTQVWLNSESKLKYPVKFQKGKRREVELVYGEAYFKVSPSTQHNGSEFHIFTKFQEVDVLGTEFNIKAYSEENDIATTLVEGRVQIQKGDISKILRPNQQSIILSDTHAIAVQEVDVSREISWVNGMFSFDEASLKEIMTVLSRWYDVEVVFELTGQKDFVFTGVVERAESVGNILHLIEGTSAGQVKFEIRDKTILIK